MSKYKYYIDKLLMLEYDIYNSLTNLNSETISIFQVRMGYEYIADKSINRNIVEHCKRICKKKPSCENCLLNKFCEYYRKELSAKKIEGFKVVDLFCGAGGFSLGFVQEGFDIKFAIDNQQCCIDTYSCNHPEISAERILCKNIQEAMGDMNLLLANEEIDVIIGGPPCQGFSMANRQRMIDDPRNKLYKQFVNSIDLLAPKFFVMENVEGILKIGKQIEEDFKKLSHSYKVMPIKINAVDFGVPQNRKRVFFIGTRLNIDLNEIFNKIVVINKNTKKTVLQDALFGLRELVANTEKNATTKDSTKSGSIIEINLGKQNSYIRRINRNNIAKIMFNHKARYNNDRDIEIFGKLNPGDRSDDVKIANIMPYTKRNDIFKDKYFKLRNDKACKTITAHMKFDCNMYIHPMQARGLTPREAARTQSYPDDYLFCGPYTKTFMQIGNSVPPLVSKTLALVIKESLEKSKQLI